GCRTGAQEPALADSSGGRHPPQVVPGGRRGHGDLLALAILGEVDELSEEQLIDRLLRLENDGLADQRAELTGERFLSLIHDGERGRSYVLRHGLDETEGAEVPVETEFWEYPTLEEAQRVHRQ